MINTVVTSPLFGLSDSRMNSEDNDADTNETYLLYKINNQIKHILKEQQKEGKEFISDNEIDNLISDILRKELGND